jgi:A/G-specific adenine glycosylase
MMELGATVCTPRAPRCDACPVARWCRAQQLGIAQQLPAARRKRATQQIHVAAAVLLDPHGRTLLLPPNGASHDGLFSRMWQFPAVEGEKGAEAKLHKIVGLHGSRGRSSDRPAGGSEDPPLHPLELKPARHSVTFREIKLRPYLMRVTALPHVAGARTPRLAQLDSLPISSATRKIARRALEHLAACGVKQRSATA